MAKSKKTQVAAAPVEIKKYPPEVIAQRAMERFEHQLQYHRDRAESSKAAFQEDAAKDPAYAVRWASGMLECLHEARAWETAAKYLAKVGDEYPTISAALAAVCEKYTDSLICAIGSGESTSLLTRADHTAEMVGKKMALRDLQGLLDNVRWMVANETF